MHLSLSLRIFYPDAVSPDEIYDYNDAFSFWRKVWIETREEIGERTSRWSDSFSRQSEIMVLYHGNQPIATCCHRYVDLRHRALLEDSYFTSAMWPEEARRVVPTLGDTCMLGSHLYVDPEFRRSRTGLPIKEIVCSLCFAHVNGTRPDAVLGMVRIDRGLDRLFHAGGAVSIHAAVRWCEKIPLDLVAFFPRKTPIVIDPLYADAVRSIGGTCDRFAVSYFDRPGR